MNLKGYVSKLKKPVSAVLSVVMIFVMFAVLAVSAPMSVSATGTETEDAILIGKANSMPSTGETKPMVNIFLPIGAKSAGEGYDDFDGEVVFKLQFKCKMLSGTQPIIGMMRTNYGSGDSTHSEHGWCYNNDVGGKGETNSYSYTMSSYDSSTGMFTAIVRAWYNETNYYRNGRWCYLTIGDAEHNGNLYMANDLSASFIMSQPTLYAYDTSTGETYGDNLVPAFNDSGCDFNGTYFLRSQGAAQYDNPYYASADKWHVDSAPALVNKIKVPANYNTSSDYNSGNFTLHTASGTQREYYTNANYSDLYFEKVRYSNDAGFKVISDINKKMIIIEANHEGEADVRDVDGYQPTKNKPANIFLPINFGQYSMNGSATQDKSFLIKVSMTAVRLEGDGYPVLGRIVGKKAATNGNGSGKGSQGLGKAAKNLHLSGYYGAGSHETYTGGDFSYNESTGAFVGWIRVKASDDDYATSWGINEIITIGNAEHVWQEGTFDTTEFNSSFAISDLKVDVYTCTGSYTVGSLLAEDIAPGLYAENLDMTSNYAYQFTNSASSNHSKDVMRSTQYKWSVDGNTGMVHAENLSTCMMNNHSLTHHAATDSTREYYHCNTCNTNYADAFGGTAISDTSATKMMAVLPAAGSGSESIFTNVRLSGFTGNQWFKFTCKVKCLGDNVPVVSTLYSVYDGNNAYETTQPSDNDGDMAVWESSYDPETYTLTGYIKAWMPTNWNKGSRYPYLRYNPISGACISIVIGNGRYIGDGYTDQNMNTRFAVTEPELYKINGATTGGNEGLTDAKSKSVTGSNLIAPITDKTIDFDSSYAMVRNHIANPLTAPIGKWCRAGNNRDIIYSSAIPSGYFDVEPTVEKPRMIRLGGYGGNQQAFSFATELTRGTTYQYDIDYRACGGVNALYKPQFSNTSTGFESLDYYNNSFTVSTSDTGTHYSIRFTMPDNAKINANNFIIYLGQKWPLRRNGTVFFANASLYKVSGGNLTGSNLITNGDFHLGAPGKVTASNKDTVFSGWNQVQVMTYPGIYLMDIPDGFFTDDKDMSLENAYEFKGGDVYKPQFDFHFAASKTYRLIYDYYCDDDDTVNAYIISKDNSVTATKNSRISENKFQAVYTITTTANTKQYTDKESANGSIRFALNGNSYAKSFRISNIRMYLVEGGNPVGANLVMSINPCLDDKYYGVELLGDEYSFSVAKNDSNCDSQKNNIAIGWVGNLDYNSASFESTYSKVIKTTGHLFDNYSSADKMRYMRKALIGSTEGYNPFTDSRNRFYDPKSDGVNNICDLVKLKKNIINNVYTYSVSNEQTNGGIYSTFNKLACYGDSITQGMGYESSPQKTYPGRLSTMLGDGYTVYNCGDPGERSYTIMARQGALSLTTSKTITFEAGQSQVHIGVNSDNGFLTRKGDYIDLTSRLGNERSINNVNIEGRTYEVIMTDFTWSPRACNIYLKRSGDTSNALTIPKGAPVIFNSYTKQDECDIYLIGANGVYTSANDLVAQYKAMVDKHGSNNFLIIIPFWNDYCDTPFREAFGDHCVSFREVAITTGLDYEGITPTSTDEEYIARGEVPPSLLYYPNNPDVHLNAKGYDLLAHILYEQGKSLGYF